MHFETVLKHLLLFFKRENIDYAVIGGIALIAMGHQRTTADLDFLLLADSFDKVEKYFLSHGYKCIEKNEHASNFVSENPILGRVDILIARTALSQEMFGRTIQRKFSDEVGVMNVACPEDMIGLKLHAAKNNEKRYFKDMADIQELFQLFGKKMNYTLLEKYFKLFKEETLLEKLWKNAPQ